MSAPSARPSPWERWIAVGAIAMGLAVALGAFGAHGLRGAVADELLAVWNTAARYQAYHALALVAVGLLGLSYKERAGKALSIAAILFTVGLLLFSGSLYALVVTGTRWLGAITPLGGVAWIGGWIALAIAALAKDAGSNRAPD